MSSELSRSQKFPLLYWFLTQAFTILFVLVLKSLFRWNDPIWVLLFHCGISSLATKFILKLENWWVLLSILAPLLFVLLNTQAQIPTYLYLAGFVLIALFFSHSMKERVPLYLTNHTTHAALQNFIEKNSIKSAVDLGCGFGGVVRAMTSPSCTAYGVETAPFAWLISKVLSSLQGKGSILRQNIWETPLHSFDLVYTFLSPVPMPQIYEKAKAEMRPQSFLISNSFPVPNVEPSEVWELSDGRKTTLYIYKF